MFSINWRYKIHTISPYYVCFWGANHIPLSADVPKGSPQRRYTVEDLLIYKDITNASDVLARSAVLSMHPRAEVHPREANKAPDGQKQDVLLPCTTNRLEDSD